MAKDSPNAGHRSRLLDMAWRQLAEQAERFDQLVRDVDQTFDAPACRNSVRTGACTDLILIVAFRPEHAGNVRMPTLARNPAGNPWLSPSG
jgi:hypothetical protein